MKSLLVLFSLAVSLSTVYAEDGKPIDRAFRIGPQYQLLSYPSSTGNPGPGYGLQGTYEFVVRPKFRIDILMSYRWFPGGTALNQLGYGLFMRHYLSFDPQAQEGWHPYLGYGLLLQISTLSGRTGTSTSHDTGLIVGTDFFVGKQRAFVEGGFHISHVAFFENPIIHLSRYEVSTGLVFEW